MARNAKLLVEKRLKEKEQELAECTFQPQLVAKQSPRKRSQSPASSHASRTPTPTPRDKRREQEMSEKELRKHRPPWNVNRGSKGSPSAPSPPSETLKQKPSKTNLAAYAKAKVEMISAKARQDAEAEMAAIAQRARQEAQAVLMREVAETQASNATLIAASSATLRTVEDEQTLPGTPTLELLAAQKGFNSAINTSVSARPSPTTESVSIGDDFSFPVSADTHERSNERNERVPIRTTLSMMRDRDEADSVGDTVETASSAPVERAISARVNGYRVEAVRADAERTVEAPYPTTMDGVSSARLPGPPRPEGAMQSVPAPVPVPRPEAPMQTLMASTPIIGPHGTGSDRYTAVPQSARIPPPPGGFPDARAREVVDPRIRQHLVPGQPPMQPTMQQSHPLSGRSAVLRPGMRAAPVALTQVPQSSAMPSTRPRR